MSESDDQIEYDRAHDSLQQQGNEPEPYVNRFELQIIAALDVVPAGQSRDEESQ